jgi:hypothetical protein
MDTIGDSADSAADISTSKELCFFAVTGIY